MTDQPDVPPHADFIARLLLLVMSAFLGLGAAFAHDASPRSAAWFWVLACAAFVFAFVAIFGPRSVRVGLVAWFPGF